MPESLEEQRAIANLCDQERVKIDALLAKGQGTTIVRLKVPHETNLGRGEGKIDGRKEG